MLKARVMCNIQSNSPFHFSSTPSMVSDPFYSGKGRHNIITMCNELIKVVLVWWFVADGFMFFSTDVTHGYSMFEFIYMDEWGLGSSHGLYLVLNLKEHKP